MMIDLKDYIRVRRKSGRILLKYHLYCKKCGNSRGYQAKCNKDYLCKSCAMQKPRSESTREKISIGVQKYYYTKHNNKPTLKETPHKKKREYKPIKTENWKRIRRDCKRRDKKYSINKRYDFNDDEIQCILNGNCFYCGCRGSLGLDRLNNMHGHCKSNCVACCHLCNMTRGDRFTPEEFKLLGNIIKRIKRRRDLRGTQL